MPYIGVAPSSGLFKKLDAITVVNAQAAYTMQYNSSNFKPATAEQLIVSVNGVIQAPTDAYTVSGSTITFSENLVTGDVIDFIVALGEVGNTVTPVDGSVDINKMSSSLMTESGGSTTFKVDNIQNSSGTDAVSIDSSGKVGVGTTSPSQPLHVKGGAVQFENTQNTYLQVNTTDTHLYTAGSHPFRLGTNSTERMRIDGSSGDVTVQSDSLTLDNALTQAIPIPRNYNINAPTINDGGYQRAWTRLGTFNSSGRCFLHFRMNYQGDHNYSRLFTCVGEVHQWESETSDFNMSIYGTGGSVTGIFKTTTSRELWFRESANWSHNMAFEILSSQGFTVDCNTYQKNQSPPAGTSRSFSSMGSIVVEAAWGS